jgi:hypothetical protein
MEKIYNKTIYEILQERGVTNCTELIKENNLNVSIQPTYNAYQYSAQKVKDHVDKLKKKNKSRPKIALELHEYLESEFIFPQAELAKRGSHVVADETLTIKGSLLRKKLKTQELTEKLFETENTVK